MITTALINLANFIIEKILSWMPDWGGFPDAVASSFSYLGTYVRLLDPLVPVSAIAICTGIVFLVELGIFGFRSFKWVISHIPFVGGGK